MNMLPCNRGIIDNVTDRGLHHFQGSEFGFVVCIYCGAKPIVEVTKVTHGPIEEWFRQNLKDIENGTYEPDKA